MAKDALTKFEKQLAKIEKREASIRKYNLGYAGIGLLMGVMLLTDVFAHFPDAFKILISIIYLSSLGVRWMMSRHIRREAEKLKVANEHAGVLADRVISEREVMQFPPPASDDKK